MSKLTHFNGQGHAKMVDVSTKAESVRTAVAKSSVIINETIYLLITSGTNKKGDVLSVAQVAAIMAAKSTPAIIPMCHQIPLAGVDIQFKWNINQTNDHYEIIIEAHVKTIGVTGVEMEALTAVSVAALTIYDMCKASGKEMVIGKTMLLSKTGGKNGDFNRQP